MMFCHIAWLFLYVSSVGAIQGVFEAPDAKVARSTNNTPVARSTNKTNNALANTTIPDIKTILSAVANVQLVADGLVAQDVNGSLATNVSAQAVAAADIGVTLSTASALAHDIQVELERQNLSEKKADRTVQVFQPVYEVAVEPDQYPSHLNSNTTMSYSVDPDGSLVDENQVIADAAVVSDATGISDSATGYELDSLNIDVKQDLDVYFPTTTSRSTYNMVTVTTTMGPHITNPKDWINGTIPVWDTTTTVYGDPQLIIAVDHQNTMDKMQIEAKVRATLKTLTTTTFTTTLEPVLDHNINNNGVIVKGIMQIQE